MGAAPLEVSGGGVDVVVDLLLGEINHVRGEEGLAVELEVGLSQHPSCHRAKGRSFLAQWSV